MARIALDLDEVLGDSLTAFLHFHNQNFGTTFTREDFHTYSFETILGVPTPEVVTRILQCYNLERVRVEPMPGARETLEELKEEHEFIVVTARMDELAEGTCAWLEDEYPGIFQGVYFSHNWHLQCSRTRKHEFCQLHGASILVDDSPEHLIPCAEHGITGILFEQPWNRNVVINDVERVSSWEVLGRVLRSIASS